jgi:hypothetical protein
VNTLPEVLGSPHPYSFPRQPLSRRRGTLDPEEWRALEPPRKLNELRGCVVFEGVGHAAG